VPLAGKEEREERAVGERERKERGCGKGRDKGTVIMDCGMHYVAAGW